MRRAWNVSKVAVKTKINGNENMRKKEWIVTPVQIEPRTWKLVYFLSLLWAEDSYKPVWDPNDRQSLVVNYWTLDFRPKETYLSDSAKRTSYSL